MKSQSHLDLPLSLAIYACRTRGHSQEFRFCEHAKQFTLEVITSCLLGEEDADLLEVLKENMPIISEAILSLPVRLPWPLSRTPLSRIPVLSFSRGLEARDRIVKGLQVVIDQRREAFSAGGAGRERKGMIDAMMALQEKQQEQGGPRENELLLDDAFISDNVSELPGHYSERAQYRALV